MRKVHDYTFANYRNSINLDDIASLAGMATTAFCRYFKARTNKTFSDFVSELRVGFACKLLMDNKLSITQICYESGFNTLSNFNKQFKNLKGQTPSEYRMAFRSNKSCINDRKHRTCLPFSFAIFAKNIIKIK